MTEIDKIVKIVKRHDTLEFTGKMEDLCQIKNIINTFSSQVERVYKQQNKNEETEHRHFNLLNILTRHHLEELHTSFLAYLLDPKGDHDFKAEFLHAFVSVIEQELVEKDLPVPNAHQVKNGILKKEHRIEAIRDAVDGRIDIFITLPGYFIAIENKIYHRESSADQIERYCKYCKLKLQPYVVLYLTLHGKPAISAGEEVYIPISYSTHILKWLNRCIEIAKNISTVSIGINYYKQLLISNFIHQIPDEIIMEIKDLLLEKENRLLLKYQNDIALAVVPVRNHLRTVFFKQAFLKLKGLGYTFNPVEELISPLKIELIWERKNSGLLLTQNEFTYEISVDKKLHFIIEQNWHNLYYGLIVLNYKNNKPTSLSNDPSLPSITVISEAMDQATNHSLEAYDEEMFSWRFYHPLKKNLPFPKDELNFDFAESMDEIVNEFVGQVDVYLKEYSEVLKSITSSGKN